MQTTNPKTAQTIHGGNAPTTSNLVHIRRTPTARPLPRNGWQAVDGSTDAASVQRQDESVNQTVARWARQLHESNSYPVELFAPLVVAVEQKMRQRVYRASMAPLGAVDTALSEALQQVRQARSIADLQAAMSRIQSASRQMKKLFAQEIGGAA